MRYPAVLCLALTLGLLAAACGGSQPASGSPPAARSTPAAPPSPSAAAATAAAAVREVNAAGKGGAFEPAQLTVKVGTTVRCTNASGNIHNLTFADGAIQPSPIMYGGATFDYTISRAGTYQYRCTFHPGMDGTVVVETG